MRRLVYQIISLLSVSLCAAFLAGCGGEPEQTKVDLADAIGGSSIVTASDLLAFVERGESSTAKLSADISLENEMLRITKARDGLVLDGNGFTLSGAGDCVIRLDEGCSMVIKNITIHGGSDAIGCLGNAAIGGENVRLIGVGNGIRAAGTITVLSGSSIESEANIGMGITASGLYIEENASLAAKGPMGGVNMSGEIQVAGGGELAAYTEENYNALKCGGTLTLKDGSKLIAENLGEYHGAELMDLDVDGAVTIQAKGGENAAGLFLFEQRENIAVIGSCNPKPRFESGKGSITFVDSAEKLPSPEELNPVAPSPTPTEAP
ncbi:MAG: hypothetical protein EOM66_00120 [Clostridia bacterium]|nr:hypothetical protein [Clostridia bacterium]